MKIRNHNTRYRFGVSKFWVQSTKKYILGHYFLLKKSWELIHQTSKRSYYNVYEISSYINTFSVKINFLVIWHRRIFWKRLKKLLFYLIIFSNNIISINNRVNKFKTPNCDKCLYKLIRCFVTYIFNQVYGP